MEPIIVACFYQKGYCLMFRFRMLITYGVRSFCILVAFFTRGRVRAGPSLQLGTLSTRIALYIRRWRASPGVLTHADYTLGAVAPLLSLLACTPAGRATHGTHSRAWRPSAAFQKRS